MSSLCSCTIFAATRVRLAAFVERAWFAGRAWWGCATWSLAALADPPAIDDADGSVAAEARARGGLQASAIGAPTAKQSATQQRAMGDLKL